MNWRVPSTGFCYNEISFGFDGLLVNSTKDNSWFVEFVKINKGMYVD